MDAERSTLGSLLIDKDAITKVADFLKPEDFYHESHARIYQAMVDLFEKRSPIDLLTMTAEGFFRERGYKKTERSSAPPEIQGTMEFQSLCPANSVCLVKKLTLQPPPFEEKEGEGF